MNGPDVKAGEIWFVPVKVYSVDEDGDVIVELLDEMGKVDHYLAETFVVPGMVFPQKNDDLVAIKYNG